MSKSFASIYNMQSIGEIYKIGYGPSSSHTMGPGRAAEQFLMRHPHATAFEVTLYGSLAMTGKGHLTDYIIYKTLGKNRTKVIFDDNKQYAYHPNALLLKAFQNEICQEEWLVFSVGGGDLKTENEPRYHGTQTVYPHHTMKEILKYCSEKHYSFIDYILQFESDSLNTNLKQVYQTMGEVIQRGLFQEGILPGGLNLIRKAPAFYKKYLQQPSLNRLLYAYSLAASEENASGGQVVTAPTCGSSAVIPAVLYTQKVMFDKSDSDLIHALMIGGLIGTLVKTNASISGAEVGCQGEIGVACSMAAAMLVYLNGDSNEMMEYAAEMALEHHLGLTCDPIGGLVQIPCIERNALAAKTAYDVAEYAHLAGAEHQVTLDDVIEVMKETGIDLHTKYKETSRGGLALRGKKGDRVNEQS